MYKRRVSPLVAVAVALVLSLTLLSVGQQLVTAQPVAQQANCQTFTETGEVVCGRFLAYWKEHGGLMQQGYPISNELNDVSEVDGKTSRMQYFERAVFEYHPERVLKNPSFARHFVPGSPAQTALI